MKILTNPHFLLTLTSIFWAFNTVAGRAAVGEVSPLLIVIIGIYMEYYIAVPFNENL